MDFEYSVMSVLSCILSLILGALTAAALSGSWHGKLNLPAGSLTITLNFDTDTDGKTICTMDSPDQGAADIPTKIDYLSADSVRVSVPAISMEYSGRVAADSICGTFRQGFFSQHVALKPGRPRIVRPQEPKPPYPYMTREVTFTNPTDSTVLSGTLSIPLSATLGGRGKVPVVVMVTGSGIQNRDEEIMSHKPFLVIADHLARHGIASLRYDDRGYGNPDSTVSEATTLTFKSDAEAALNYVRSLGEFGRAGVLGHSEGGLIAYVIAAGGGADFIVSLAGPAQSGTEVLLYQNRKLLAPALTPDVLDKYIEALAETFRYVSTAEKPISQTEAENFVSAIGAASTLPDGLKANLQAILTSVTPWMRQFLSLDPAPYIKDITVPVCAAIGALDMQVPGEATVRVLNERQGIHPTDAIRLYPGLNHMLQHASTGMPDEYGRISETISEDVLRDISAFIQSVSR